MIRLAVRVARADAEIVLAELLELAPGGLEERELGDDAVEYAIYGAPGELPSLPDVRAAAGGALVDISTTELPDDWDDRWRTWHPAVVVEAGGRTLRVRPPWEEARPGTVDVAIEPAQAFGTGAHETTRLSLQLLMELTPDGPLADWGCGSGVLAIAAAKLGFSPVTGCDVDRVRPRLLPRGTDAQRPAAALDDHRGVPGAPAHVPVVLQLGGRDVDERVAGRGLEVRQRRDLAGRAVDGELDGARVHVALLEAAGGELGQLREHELGVLAVHADGEPDHPSVTAAHAPSVRRASSRMP